MKKLSILTIVILFSVVAQSQTLKQYIKAADEAFENENYYFALTNYRVALDVDSTRSDLYLKAAESSRKMLGYTTAAEMYKKYLTGYEIDSVPDRRAYFWYGLTLMNQGLYDSASVEFSTYLAKIDSNEVFYGQKARLSLESCQFSKMLIENPLNIEIDSALTEVNTAYSEFAPFVYEEKLYYSSMDFQPQKPNPALNTKISKVLNYSFSEEEKMLLNENINHPNLLTSNAAIDKEDNLVYFTICNYLTGAEIHCDLYSADINKEGEVGSKKKLPDNINLSGFTNTHPTIMDDPNDKSKYLIFVSDRPGGEGKLDLWRSEVLGENLFGTPRNMEAINTFDDDVTPYYNHSNNKLYFATRGRKGLGEFDIYQSTYKNGKWESITNMGFPINSSTNDLYPFIAENGRDGYFASNRPGSILFYEEEDACCYDIYRFQAVSQSRTIYISTLMNTPLDLNVEPLDFNKDVIAILDNTVNGKSIHNPDSLLQYIYLPKRDFIGNDKLVIGLCSDQGMKFCDTINFIIEVRPIPEEIHEFTTKEFTKLSDCIPLIGFSNKDSLVITSCDDGLQDGKIQYTVLGDKLCFEYLPNYGFLGRDQMCLEICNSNPRDKCIRKIIKFNIVEENLKAQLPVVLYFDNDLPRPGKNVKSSNSNYIKLHKDYINKKKEFVNNYSFELEGQEQKISAQEMNSFFDNVVNDCDDDLNRFITTVERLLKDDKAIEVYIKGFTSPRAAEGYNIELSTRRINSVVNYFRAFSDGVLGSYIDNGLLKIIEKPIGEAQAPDYVSDDLKDRRNSVYSIEASVERRVEIVDVKRINITK